MSRHSLPFGLERNKPVVALHPLCLLKQPAQKIYDGTKRIGPTKRYPITNVALSSSTVSPIAVLPAVPIKSCSLQFLKRLPLFSSPFVASSPLSSRGKRRHRIVPQPLLAAAQPRPFWFLASEHCGVVLLRSGPEARHQNGGEQTVEGESLHRASSPWARCD